MPVSGSIYAPRRNRGRSEAVSTSCTDRPRYEASPPISLRRSSDNKPNFFHQYENVAVTPPKTTSSDSSDTTVHRSSWDWLTGDDGLLEDAGEFIGHATWGAPNTLLGLGTSLLNFTVGNAATAIHNNFTSNKPWEYASMSLGGPNRENDVIGNYGGLFNMMGLGDAFTLGPSVFYGGSHQEATRPRYVPNTSGTSFPPYTRYTPSGIEDYYKHEPRHSIYDSDALMTTTQHEEGHEDQNLLYGPLAPLFGLGFSLLPNTLNQLNIMDVPMDRTSWPYWYDRQASTFGGPQYGPFNTNPDIYRSQLPDTEK